MKKVFLGLMLIAMSSVAFGSAQLTMSDGTTTVVVNDNGSGDLDSAPGTIIFSGAIGTWSVNVQVGVSLGPGTSHMDLGSTALSTGASTLTIKFSDVGFTTLASPFNLTYTGGTPTNGSATGKGFVDNSNTLYGTASQIGSTLGPFTGGFNASTSGGSGTPLYSLTEQVALTSTGLNSSTFSTDLSLTGVAVPEPASVALLGGVLLLTARTIRRRMRRA